MSQLGRPGTSTSMSRLTASSGVDAFACFQVEEVQLARVDEDLDLLALARRGAAVQTRDERRLALRRLVLELLECVAADLGGELARVLVDDGRGVHREVHVRL